MNSKGNGPVFCMCFPRQASASHLACYFLGPLTQISLTIQNYKWPRTRYTHVDICTEYLMVSAVVWTKV